jgi:alkylation response protein AidB-like acyl-CoA dehydrogenase
MYGFDPTQEQQMLMDAIGRFAASDLRPAAQAAEADGEFLPDILKKGWELGLLQASTPEAYGGFGERSAVTGALAMEEFSFGDLAGAMSVMLPALFATPICLTGSEDQKKVYLPNVVGGDWAPYTAALIEFAFDFDPGDLRTTAKLSGDEYVLDGEKAFVPFAKEAEAMLLYASVDGKTQGFIVPKNSPGLTILAEREKLLGLNALPLYRVLVTDVTIPASNRLGGASGHDFEPILAAMRVASAAAAVGLARAAFEYSRDYAKEREAFGMKIAQKQAVAFMLAEMRTEIEASRLLTWEAAWRLDQGRTDAPLEAYLAVTGAADMVMLVTDRALQILGGHGYIRDHPVELWMRNGRGFAMLTGLAIV